MSKLDENRSRQLIHYLFQAQDYHASKMRNNSGHFCSILDLPTSAKYDGTVERVARGLRPLSTEPGADLAGLYRRVIFAWLIADGDMHLRNLAVLKIAQADAETFSSVRLAPLYDSLTTQVFPGLANDRMALKLNGKDDRLNTHDFLASARVMGLSMIEAETAIGEVASRLAERIETLHLPEWVRQDAAAVTVEDKIRTILRKRAQTLLR
jgi:serine/threonine-protein kinase HipA